jgi:uncharacterized membrane protein
MYDETPPSPAPGTEADGDAVLLPPVEPVSVERPRAEPVTAAPALAGGERTPEGDVVQILIGISFADSFRAQEFLTAATRLASTGDLKLKDAVLVAKDGEGKTHVRETTDIQPGQAAFSGALWASLFGLILGGPVGWIAGAAIGAGGGALTAKAVDIGITDEWVSWFRAAVEPGHTVVAILADDANRTALATEIARFPGAHILYTNLAPDWTTRFG